MLDFKVLQLGVILYFAVALPINTIHELGHALVCEQSGHKASLILDWRGMATNCQPDLTSFSFYVTGPVLGSVTSLAVVLAGRLVHNRLGRGLLIAGTAFSADQISKIALEGFLTKQYESGVFDLAITIFQMVSLVVSAFMLSRVEKMTPALKGRNAGST